jgi:hypothetical protein
MIEPGYQWETPVLLSCPSCGTANPNKAPWTASKFMLVSCSNQACPNFGVNLLVEKDSLTVMTVAEAGGK